MKAFVPTGRLRLFDRMRGETGVPGGRRLAVVLDCVGQVLGKGAVGLQLCPVAGACCQGSGQPLQGDHLLLWQVRGRSGTVRGEHSSASKVQQLRACLTASTLPRATSGPPGRAPSSSVTAEVLSGASVAVAQEGSASWMVRDCPRNYSPRCTFRASGMFLAPLKLVTSGHLVSLSHLTS